MDVVEHWWGGEWGTMSRRDAWLETDGQRWRVRIHAQGDDYETAPCSEQAARRELAKVLASGRPWVQV